MTYTLLALYQNTSNPPKYVRRSRTQGRTVSRVYKKDTRIQGPVSRLIRDLISSLWLLVTILYSLIWRRAKDEIITPLG